MIVGMTSLWEHPIAYVLQYKYVASVQKQKLKTALVYHMLKGSM